MNARHVPRILAELPPEWGSVESAELFGPGGIVVKVTAQPVGRGLDTAGLAARHGELLAEVVDAYRDGGVEDGARFGGHPALCRRTRFSTDVGAGRGLAVYLVVDGTAYVASATGPADAFAAREVEVAGMIERLTILGRPLVTTGTDGGPAAGPQPSPAETGTSSSVEPSAWREVRRSWQEAREGAEAVDDPSSILLSTDELLVIASILGLGTFPTVDPLALGDLPRSAREVVSQAISRSLVLRGVLEVHGDALVVAGPSIGLVDAALFPDLYVEVFTTVAGTTSVSALCARPGATVVVEPHGAEGRRLTWARSEDLVELAIDHGGLRSTADGTGSARTVAVEELRRSVSVRSSWREGRAVVSGETMVVVDADGSLGSVDDAPPPRAVTVVVRPATLDGVRAELIDHLPGSAPRGARASGVLR